jgi:hypothetical protein
VSEDELVLFYASWHRWEFLASSDARGVKNVTRVNDYLSGPWDLEWMDAHRAQTRVHRNARIGGHASGEKKRAQTASDCLTR